jgi:hypothetical protein
MHRVHLLTPGKKIRTVTPGMYSEMKMIMPYLYPENNFLRKFPFTLYLQHGMLQEKSDTSTIEQYLKSP